MLIKNNSNKNKQNKKISNTKNQNKRILNKNNSDKILREEYFEVLINIDTKLLCEKIKFRIFKQRLSYYGDSEVVADSLPARPSSRR